MVIAMLLKHRWCDGEALDQAHTTHQLATGLALREVNPTAFAGRASTDLPRLPSSQDQVEPLLLHDESSLRRAPDATAFTRPLLDSAFLHIPCVPWIALAVATKCFPLGIARPRIFFEALCAEFGTR